MAHPDANACLMQMTLAAGVTEMRKVNIESIFPGDHNMFTDYDTESDFLSFFFFNSSLFPYFMERFTTKILCGERKGK